MNGFEELVGGLLEAEGYWIQHSFKVSLTKDEKREIGRPSSPRWEIDLLAYSAPENVVLAVECKSYLDSPGVDLADVQGGRYADRYKLFTDPVLRGVVFRRLVLELTQSRYCPPNPTVKLALAAGRLKSDPERVRAYFRDHDWLLFDPEWISQQLRASARRGYTDSVAVMVAKLLPLDNGRKNNVG